MAGPGLLATDAIYAGDTWPGESYTVTDPATGEAIDLVAAGWGNWRAQWRPSTGSGTVINLDIDDTQAASGIIARKPLAGAQTESMGGPGGWDLQADDADGQTVTWLRGETTWTQDYTR